MSNVYSFILIPSILSLFLFTSCGLEKYESEAAQDIDEISEEDIDEISDEDQMEYIPEECRVLEPGIVLTFDDFLINEWYQAHLDLFLENDVKATFFLHKVYLLQDDSEKLQKVLEMQNFGHEMGCHTMNHVKLTDYLAVKTIDEYLDEEIEPSISTAKSLGIDFKSFAYPYGVGTEELDNLLLNYFSALRYTAGGVSAKRGNIFYNNKCTRIIFSGGTDAPSNPTKEKISEAINKAFDEKKILVLLGHEITKEAPGNHPYYVTYELLEWIISEAKEKNMKFYTVSEIFSGQNEVEPEGNIFSIYK